MRLTKTLRAGIVAAALSAVPLVAQDQPHNSPNTADQTYSRQHQGDRVGNANPANAPTSNPGFGPQVPNDVTGYTGPQQNSTYQKDRNGNLGFHPGWLGLLGLAGLFGLRRGSTVGQEEHHHVPSTPHMSHG